MQTPTGAVTCSRPPGRTGRGPQPGVRGRPLRRPGFCLWAVPPARTGGWKDAPPRRLQEGAEFPGAADSSPRQRGLTGQPTRAWGCAAGLVGRAGMDSLFVEEVAASLVREFLSRKVRGVACADRANRCPLGRTGAPLQPLHLRGGRPPPACRLLPASEIPGKATKRHFPGRNGGSALPRTPLCHLPLGPQPLGLAGPLRAEGGPGAMAQRRPPWRTRPEASFPPGKTAPPKREPQELTKFPPVRPCSHVHPQLRPCCGLVFSSAAWSQESFWRAGRSGET